MQQPAKWKVEFQLPQAAITAEYVVSNNNATVTRQDANLFAFLTRLHKGIGMNAGWVLLADTLAGALVFLHHRRFVMDKKAWFQIGADGPGSWLGRTGDNADCTVDVMRGDSSGLSCAIWSKIFAPA